MCILCLKISRIDLNTFVNTSQKNETVIFQMINGVTGRSGLNVVSVVEEDSDWKRVSTLISKKTESHAMDQPWRLLYATLPRAQLKIFWVIEESFFGAMFSACSNTILILSLVKYPIWNKWKVLRNDRFGCKKRVNLGGVKRMFKNTTN